MLSVMVLLVMVWGMGVLVDDIGMVDYFVVLLGECLLLELILLVMFFVVSVVVFVIGMLWGMMVILLLMIVLLVLRFGGGDLMLVVLVVVFDGVIFGDYCLLIFDIIVMLSIVFVCNYFDYVCM